MAPTVPELRLSQRMLPRLSPVFQKGIRVKVQTGCSLESLLCDQWGLSPEYVMTRISTLFLNGKPVDDISVSRISDGSVLALSSAMPGLVGAVMRRGGFFSSLRGSISYREQAHEDHVRRGHITVKLFNLLIRELSPMFLTMGFFANRDDLPEGLTGQLGIEPGGGEIFIVS